MAGYPNMIEKHLDSPIELTLSSGDFCSYGAQLGVNGA
jgi:hypothetical protein